MSGVLAGCTVPAALSLALGYDGRVTAVAVLMSAVTSAVWTSIRLVKWAWTPTGAQVVLAGFVVAAAVVFVLSALWPAPPSGSAVQRWLDELDFPLVLGRDMGYLTLVASLALVLLGTANALVRLTLTSVGAVSDAAERRTRAGRLIGAIERLLIAGFTIAGEPTAAAVVVSAKSLIRLPEISGKPSDVDDLTEYLLVGSLVSWLIAFGSAALVLKPT